MKIIYTIIPALIFSNVFHGHTKSNVFLTTRRTYLVVDNEEVYQLAICGTGHDRVLVLGEELCNYLQIIPQLITVSSSYNLP